MQLIEFIQYNGVKISIVLCPALKAPIQGKILVSGRTPGNSVNYYCIEGFKLMGPKERTCTKTATWDRFRPKCICK